MRVDELALGAQMCFAPARGNEGIAGSAARGVDGGVAVLERLETAARPALQEQGIVKIEDLGTDDVFDIQTESGNFLTNNVVVHNCFINKVEDRMESILTLAKTEGMLFKYGSGTGSNLSPLRSSRELLAGGGTAAGPVPLLKRFDALARAIQSGRQTRRAGQMVILQTD